MTGGTGVVSSTGTDFLIADPVGTSNFSTSLTVFDSLGNGHVLNTYFTKIGGNSWNYNQVTDASAVTVLPGFTSGANALVASGMLTFTTNGALEDRKSTRLNSSHEWTSY